MSPYEYFIGAISIVVGLSVSSILVRAFTLVGARSRVTFNWVPLIWALCILAWLIQYWYVGWLVNEFRGWSFAIFLLMMLAMISLYGAAELILPGAEGDQPIDLGEHFSGTGRLALGFFAGYFALAFPINHFVLNEADPGGTLWDSAFLPVVGFVIISWGALARSPVNRLLAALVFLAFSIWLYSGMISDELEFGSLVVNDE